MFGKLLCALKKLVDLGASSSDRFFRTELFFFQEKTPFSGTEKIIDQKYFPFRQYFSTKEFTSRSYF